jgi:hypothetical protein
MKNFWPLFLRPYNLKEHKVNKHNEQAAWISSVNKLVIAIKPTWCKAAKTSSQNLLTSYYVFYCFQHGN